MMQDITQQDLFTKLDRFSGFAIVNLLWVISCLFVITIPAATVGLFAVITDSVRGKNSEALGRFFGAIRQQGVKASIIGLLDAVLIGLIVLNINLLPQMGLPAPLHYPFVAITLFISLLLVTSNLYLWPLLVIYDLKVKTLIDIAIKLNFSHFGWSLCLLGMTLFALTLGFLLPALISVLVLFSSCTYLITWGAWRIIQHYDTELRQMTTQEGVFSL